VGNRDEVLDAIEEFVTGTPAGGGRDRVLATVLFTDIVGSTRCALAVGEAARALGIEIRAGLHTGEVELRADSVAGIAVHIGARVSALAGPGEVWVTGTVKDLVIGSGIEFVDVGNHALKGVPGEWRLYRVVG
jgi:class 3 adenylate cyclase